MSELTAFERAPEPTVDPWVFSDPRKCNACERRRQTLECCSCQEHYCRKCLRETERPKDKPKAQPICEGCYDEAVSYATWGPFGPP